MSPNVKERMVKDGDWASDCVCVCVWNLFFQVDLVEAGVDSIFFQIMLNSMFCETANRLQQLVVHVAIFRQ